MKFLGILGSIVIMVFLSSSIAYRGENVSDRVADFKIENNRESFRLSDLDGRDVTLHFWSASDPESRMENVRLARAERKRGHIYISICTDKDAGLAKAILQADGVDEAGQFMASDVTQGDPVGYYASYGTRTLRL